MNAFIDRQNGWLNGFLEKKKRNYEYNTECVVYVLLHCPACDSIKIRCIKKDGNIRYHVCQDCKKKFKSVEK